VEAIFYIVNIYTIFLGMCKWSINDIIIIEKNTWDYKHYYYILEILNINLHLQIKVVLYVSL